MNIAPPPPPPPYLLRPGARAAGADPYLRPPATAALLQRLLTLTSAAKVPMVESYLSRWLACFTPPLSLTHTTSRLELVRPSQQRRNWRPMRPKPLMATRSFLADTVTWRLPARPCTAGKGWGAAAALGGGARAAAAAAPRLALASAHKRRELGEDGEKRARRGREQPLVPSERIGWCKPGVWAHTHGGGGARHGGVEVHLGAAQHLLVGAEAGELAGHGLQAGAGGRWGGRSGRCIAAQVDPERWASALGRQRWSPPGALAPRSRPPRGLAGCPAALNSPGSRHPAFGMRAAACGRRAGHALGRSRCGTHAPGAAQLR